MTRAAIPAAVLILILALVGALSAAVQDQTTQDPQQQDAGPPVISQDYPSQDHAVYPARPADGRRAADLPIETYAVTPGTKFLVRLESVLDTGSTREHSRFRVRTLEPLEAGSGIYLPPGAEIRGHVSRIEPAGIAGRARLWLTFDEIHTRFGALPIVAEVTSVPGDHTVRTGGPKREGVIEARTSTQQSAAEAAAAGAAMGAVQGVKDRDKREVAEGAAAGAIAAYLMESGRGHELDLPKGAKLELELERALYLVKE
jgi:hypothetical protein